MENASKALLIVGGILLGILILTLMVTLFQSSRELFEKYNETRRIEAIQQFNANFIKYVGQELTIHQVVTICNFAKVENNKIHQVTVQNEKVTVEAIKFDVERYSAPTESDPGNIITYKLEIVSYTNEGYIKEIKISEISKN